MQSSRPARLAFAWAPVALAACQWMAAPAWAQAQAAAEGAPPASNAASDTSAGTGTTATTPNAPQRVEIVGTSPLPGQGVDRNQLPYATQVWRRSAIEGAKATNSTDLANRRMTGTQVNDIQGSPFQGDLTFRGYRASGMIGSAQGLSVYLDGVRINEPFGDVVNWDLIPEASLDSIALVPGANPAFGLNTLGGALSLTTASGQSAPGVRAHFSAGSFGRQRADVSYGHADEQNDLYLAAGAFGERGWRDHSEGELGNVLAKAGRRTDWGTFSLSLLGAKSTLAGNGLLPMQAWDENLEASVPDLGSGRRGVVYTHPDITWQRLGQAQLRWSHSPREGALWEAQAYVRSTRRDTYMGDVADDPTPDVNAAINRAHTQQRATGLSLAFSQVLQAHRFQVGATLDRSRVRFLQTEQEALFDSTRGVEAIAGEPEEMAVDLHGRSQTLGLYATDTWTLTPGTHLTATLRYNRSQVINQLTAVDDQTNQVRVGPEERFTYTSLNPALGLAHALGQSGWTAFANVARDTRVPTVIELGCADPNEPCRLPAGMQSDPYLAQVRAQSVEVGVRRPMGNGWRAGLSLYRTDNRNDILFRSVSVSGQAGYFENFPKTRHQGLDAEAELTLGRWTLGAAYSLLDATYQTAATLRQGERNVTIVPGTRGAGLPRHTLKLSADGRFGAWTLGADLQANSRRVTQGNEDGLIEDGGNDRVDWSIPGYALVNLRAAWRPASVEGLELYATVQNAFNRRTASFGQVGETVFDAAGVYTGVQRTALFVAPGAPRSFQVGLRYRY